MEMVFFLAWVKQRQTKVKGSKAILSTAAETPASGELKRTRGRRVNKRKKCVNIFTAKPIE